MPFAHSPTETLTIILEEPSFSNQTISFGEESIEVNKSVLAAHSTYFRVENPIDFSHLPVSSLNFFSFIKSFYGQSFTLNENNVYDFYYLTHYFQDEKLTDFIEANLNTQLVTWAWLKPFVQEADERNDLRALEFVGPFLSKIDDVLIDDVMTITTEGFKTLSKYCTSLQSLSWLIKSLVRSILNHNFDITEFLIILNSCSVEVLSFQQWDEFLFVPLKDVEELSIALMKFLFTKVQNVCVDTVVKENSDLKTGISGLEASVSKLQAEIEELKRKMVRFSQTRKHSKLHVTEDKKRVSVLGSTAERNVLGDAPLLPGSSYTWKLRYQGTTRNLWVGVIDESRFTVSGRCFENAHCFHNGNYGYGCLFECKTNPWSPGDLLHINANLINYTLTIKSLSNSSVYLKGTLPRLSSGNYYSFANLSYSDQVLEIVEGYAVKNEDVD
ncbi:hypothetical protein GEMRC1_004676 [Eukaryota sp. GEM-RC1]